MKDSVVLRDCGRGLLITSLSQRLGSMFLFVTKKDLSVGISLIAMKKKGNRNKLDESWI